jgi:DNA-binding GntR family transcriptional regulator
MPLNTKSLRQQVYEHLKAQLNSGALEAGRQLDLNRLAADLGTSRTPLREALLQLDHEGFVTIQPRRGVVVNALTLEEIRSIYEIVGALEAAALLSSAPALSGAVLDEMKVSNAAMREALDRDDFDAYYDHNLAFHDAFLDRCGNGRLVATVGLLKERLYDFPRRKGFVKAWEEASVLEHEALLARLAAGDVHGAADALRDVHWSYAVQEPFIRRYYEAMNHNGRPGGEE